MTQRPFTVEPDIRDARAIDPEFHRSPEIYRDSIETIFARSWHYVGAEASRGPGSIQPEILLPGCLDEPLVFTRDAGGALHALSNVCTHRASLVACDRIAKGGSLRCRYHGRRFGLDGRFVSMPECETARGFPSPSDDLPKVPMASLGGMLFAGVRPSASFGAWLGPLAARLSFVDWDALTLDDERTYEVAAHWGLYCDNYLEGFHIPFVHASLNEALDYGEYRTELFEWGSLQLGIAKRAEERLPLPPDHPDAGAKIAAYYAFLFPATMINVYDWGVSINAIRPKGPDRTSIHFASWVADPSKRGRGAGGDLHRVELEDEAVVEAVQRGVRSRFYRAGRLSPRRELGVHHFHQLIARSLSDRIER